MSFDSGGRKLQKTPTPMRGQSVQCIVFRQRGSRNNQEGDDLALLNKNGRYFSGDLVDGKITGIIGGLKQMHGKDGSEWTGKTREREG